MKLNLLAKRSRSHHVIPTSSFNRPHSCLNNDSILDKMMIVIALVAFLATARAAVEVNSNGLSFLVIGS